MYLYNKNVSCVLFFVLKYIIASREIPFNLLNNVLQHVEQIKPLEDFLFISLKNGDKVIA